MCVLEACRAAFQGGYGYRRVEVVDSGSQDLKGFGLCDVAPDHPDVVVGVASGNDCKAHGPLGRIKRFVSEAHPQIIQFALEVVHGIKREIAVVAEIRGVAGFQGKSGAGRIRGALSLVIFPNADRGVAGTHFKVDQDAEGLVVFIRQAGVSVYDPDPAIAESNGETAQINVEQILVLYVQGAPQPEVRPAVVIVAVYVAAPENKASDRFGAGVVVVYPQHTASVEARPFHYVGNGLENTCVAVLPGRAEAFAALLPHKAQAAGILELFVADQSVHIGNDGSAAVSGGVASDLRPGVGHAAFGVGGNGHTVVVDVRGGIVVEKAGGAGHDGAVFPGRPGRRVVAAEAVVEKAAPVVFRVGVDVVAAAHGVAVLMAPAGAAQKVGVHAVERNGFGAGNGIVDVGKTGVGGVLYADRTHVASVAAAHVVSVLAAVPVAVEVAEALAGIVVVRVIREQLRVPQPQAGFDVAVTKQQGPVDDAVRHKVVDAAFPFGILVGVLGVADEVILRHVFRNFPDVGVEGGRLRSGKVGLDLGLLLFRELAQRRAVLVAAAEMLHAALLAVGRQFSAGLGVEDVVFLGRVGVFHPAHQGVLVVGEVEDLPVAVVAGLKIARPHFHHVDVAVSHAHGAGEDPLGGLEYDLIPVLQGFDLFREIRVLKLRNVRSHDLHGAGRFEIHHQKFFLFFRRSCEKRSGS